MVGCVVMRVGIGECEGGHGDVCRGQMPDYHEHHRPLAQLLGLDVAADPARDPNLDSLGDPPLIVAGGVYKHSLDP